MFPCTLPMRAYALASSICSSWSPADSPSRRSRYFSASATIIFRTGVDPARGTTASCTPRIMVFASCRTSLKRRSARSRSLCAISACWRAMRACHAVAAVPLRTARSTTAAAATPNVCRAMNLPARYRDDPLRAVTGKRSRWRLMSSDNCSTDAYRCCGSLRSAFRTMSSRSPARRRRSLDGDPSRVLLNSSGVRDFSASSSWIDGPLIATVLGRLGSVSHTACASSNELRAGPG